MKYNEEHQRIAQARVVIIAQGILDHAVGIIEGARQLTPLRFDVCGENNPDFIYFVGLNSETDHLPLGESRSRWNCEALKAKDAELKVYEAKVSVEAMRRCRGLIDTYRPLGLGDDDSSGGRCTV